MTLWRWQWRFSSHNILLLWLWRSSSSISTRNSCKFQRHHKHVSKSLRT